MRDGKKDPLTSCPQNNTGRVIQFPQILSPGSGSRLVAGFMVAAAIWTAGTEIVEAIKDNTAETRKLKNAVDLARISCKP